MVAADPGSAQPASVSTIRLVVGRIGRAHGVHGDVGVEVRTDDPDIRFADGAVLVTDPVERGPLTVAGSRWHSGRLLVHFIGVEDRNASEALRGTDLVVDVERAERPADPEEFYDHHLVGLRVQTTAGELVGMVAEVLHLPAQDVLAITRTDGVEILVPFVSELVPGVDLEAQRVTVVAKPGLLDPEFADEAREGP
jgi:16S rRNA processing protein RimM